MKFPKISLVEMPAVIAVASSISLSLYAAFVTFFQ